MPYLSIDSLFLKSPHGQLNYQQYGDGEKILLVFHGFGQNHAMAVPLVELLKDKYTIYSFDLPYHGESLWDEKEVLLTKNKVREIFSHWFVENGIKDFSVLGYSMGGKFALSLTESFPNEVQRLILIAPDGLHKSPWYQIATSFPLKYLFKHIIQYPSFFFRLTNLISKTALIPTKLIHFSESQMETVELRKQVYFTWMNFQKLYTNRKALKLLTNEYDVTIYLILGKKDRVINPKRIKSFVKDIEQIKLDVLPSGHGFLVQASIPLLRKYLS